MLFCIHLNKTKECYMKCLVAGPIKTQKGIWVQKSKAVSLEALLIICLFSIVLKFFCFLLFQISDTVSVNMHTVILIIVSCLVH